MTIPDRPARHQVTFLTLTTPVLAFALLQSLIIPVLPTYQDVLDASQADVTWIVTAPLLSAAVSTPIVGRLGDLMGKKRGLLITLAVLAVGCVLSAMATTLGIMIVGRVIQGVGAGVLPLAFGIVRDELPAMKVSGAVSMIASMSAAGGGVGLVLAGPVVDLLGLDWLFWLPAIMVLLSAALAHVVVPGSHALPGGSINWLAGLLLSGFLVTLLLPVSQGSSWGWTNPVTLGLAVASVGLAAGWVGVESRARTPLIDLRMMRLRAVWTTNLVALLVGISLYGSYAFLPQFLRTPPSVGYGFGASVTEAGLMVAPLTAASFLAGMATGALSRRYGARNVLLAGSAVSVVGYLLFALVHAERWQVFGIVTVMGAGIGACFSSLPALIVDAVPREQTGVASGMNVNIRTIGGAIGSALMAAVVTAQLGPTGMPDESGYTRGFLLMGAVMAVSLALALLIPVRQASPTASITRPRGPAVRRRSGRRSA